MVTAEIMRGASNSSVSGSAWDVNQAVNLSFQVVTASGDVDGTVKIQASNDNPSPSGNRAGFAPDNWSDIPSATSTITNGVGNMIIVQNASFQYVRALFTHSGGGASNVDIIVNGNAVGV
jgi:hypothetical protein